eukprot:12397949-Karenia_brevis.AAC.1
MRWGMQYSGVGVEYVYDPGLKNGTVGEILGRRGGCQSRYGIIVSQEMHVAISGQSWWVKRGSR